MSYELKLPMIKQKPFRLVRALACASETNLGVIHISLLWQWSEFLNDWMKIVDEIKARGFCSGDRLGRWGVCLNYEEDKDEIKIHLFSMLYGPSVALGYASAPHEVSLVLRLNGQSRREAIAEFKKALDVVEVSKQPHRWIYSEWLTYFELYKSRPPGESPYGAAKRLLNLDSVRAKDPINQQFQSKRDAVTKAFKVLDRMFRLKT